MVIIDLITAFLALSLFFRFVDRLEEKLNHNPKASKEEKEKIYQEYIKQNYGSVDLFGRKIYDDKTK